MLDFSRIEAKKMELEIQPIDARQAVASVCSLHQANAKSKGLQVSIDGQKSTETWCLADPVRLRQILSNLVSNAIKFTRAGSIRVSVSAKPDHGRSVVRFEVADTGIGISAEATSRLFQPFSQANSATTRRFGGSGLGLSISRRLVEMMEGAIGVESAEGRGSTFWFELPACEPATKGQASLGPEACRVPATRAGFPNARVLIVDDNVNNRLVASQLRRQRHGFSPDLAEHGLLALEQLRKQPYDLVLMDCMMPEMDGFQATRAIRAGEAGSQNRTVPIVALTAITTSQDRQACVACGMNDYLLKPVKPAALASVFSKWIPIHQTSQVDVAAAEAELPLFDPAVLHELFEDDNALISSLLDTFLESLEETSSFLRDAVERQERPEAIRFLAHRLKGSAAEYGVERLARHATLLEDSCAAGDLEGTYTLLPKPTKSPPSPSKRSPATRLRSKRANARPRRAATLV